MTTRVFISLTIVFVALAALTVPATALAQDNVTQQVEQHSAEGVEHFQNDDFEAAIESFSAAYELQAVPNLLFNIGRAYEGLEDWESAKEYFDRFVRSPDVDSESREMALDRIQSLREIQAAEAGEDDEESEASASADDASPEPEPVDIDAPSRLPAYSALGGGAILLAGGAAVGMMARSNVNTMEDTSLSLDERRSAQSSASTQAVVADIFFVAGLAATSLGAYLFFDRRSDSGEGAVVSPWTDGDSSGLGFTLDF